MLTDDELVRVTLVSADATERELELARRLAARLDALLEAKAALQAVLDSPSAYVFPDQDAYHYVMNAVRLVYDDLEV